MLEEVRNLGDAKICDLFGRAAQLEMAWIAANRAAQLKIDAAGGMFFADITISIDRFLGIPSGNHAIILVAFTKDNQTVELAFWEPQQPANKPFTYEPLEKAITAGIDLRDVIFLTVANPHRSRAPPTPKSLRIQNCIKR